MGCGFYLGIYGTYIVCLTCPTKDNSLLLVTSKVCFVSEKAGLLDHSNNKFALRGHKYHPVCLKKGRSSFSSTASASASVAKKRKMYGFLLPVLKSSARLSSFSCIAMDNIQEKMFCPFHAHCAQMHRENQVTYLSYGREQSLPFFYIYDIFHLYARAVERIRGCVPNPTYAT